MPKDHLKLYHFQIAKIIDTEKFLRKSEGEKKLLPIEGQRQELHQSFSKKSCKQE